MNTKPKLKTIQAAMRAAATRGFDPLNSHTVQAEMVQRHWRMDEGREQFRSAEQRRHRSEAIANQELAELLREGHEMCDMMERGRQAR